MDDRFDIPVVLFFFRRKNTLGRIIERISQVKPKKIYLISDGPRNDQENLEVIECRKIVEKHINWDCEIIKNYADENMGVYNRIGEGAKWVFTLEEKAIFLEDDNLPEISFFDYCRTMLEEYEDDTRILWVCGTNYLEKYIPDNGASYIFTKHLLPCGWASWSNKFIKYYDGEMRLLNDKKLMNRLKYTYSDKKLYRQQLNSLLSEHHRVSKGMRPSSWDFQMAFSLRIHNMYGISPINNQIENIGVDEYSTHGGTSLQNEMTKRFCGIKTFPLEFPLIHPKIVLEDIKYEKKVGRIILHPFRDRAKFFIASIVKKIFGINKFDKFTLKKCGSNKVDTKYDIKD